MSEEPTEPRTQSTDAGTLPPETAIGRVTIRVGDVERVVPFYREAIGCRVERDGPTARLSADDGRVLLVLEEAPDALPRPRPAAGLFHAAIRLPDRPSLADALARLRDAEAAIEGASDHLVSEALYLRDPAGNGLELYCDRPREAWTRLDGGGVEMDTLPLDAADLAAAGNGAARDVLPGGTDVGHVHLEVTDLAESGGFYGDGVGFETTGEYVEGARFLAAGDYHHHVGINVWNRRTEPSGDHQGLTGFEVVLPDAASRDEVVGRLESRGHEVVRAGDAPTTTDPDGVRVAFPVREAGDG